MRSQRKLGSWRDVDAFAIAVGQVDERAGAYQLSSAFQLWLTGLEFQDTVFLFTKQKLIILTSMGKGA